MNKNYRIHAKVKSYSVLPKDSQLMEIFIKGEGINNRLAISNTNTLSLVGHIFTNELVLIYELYTDTIMNAISFSRKMLNDTLDQIAFAVGMPVYDLEIVKVYQISDNNEDLEYIQFFNNSIDKVGSREADTEILTTAITTMMKQDNERIQRSLHWYRKSLKEEDPLDRLSYIWIGLETLNPIFQQIYPNEAEITRCENCKFEKPKKNTSALKRFFIDELSNGKLYSAARDIRTGLVHGFVDLTELKIKSIEIIPALTKALRSANCFVTGLDIELLNYEIDMWDASPVSCMLSTKLSNLMTDIKDSQFIEPNFELKIDIEEQQNNLILHPSIKTNVLDLGAGIGPIDFKVLGRPGYPLKYMQIQISG